MSDASRRVLRHPPHTMPRQPAAKFASDEKPDECGAFANWVRGQRVAGAALRRFLSLPLDPSHQNFDRQFSLTQTKFLQENSGSVVLHKRNVSRLEEREITPIPNPMNAARDVSVAKLWSGNRDPGQN